MHDGRVHAERLVGVLGMPGAARHVQQGAAVPAHVLQKMPRRDCEHPP